MDDVNQMLQTFHNEITEMKRFMIEEFVQVKEMINGLKESKIARVTKVDEVACGRYEEENLIGEGAKGRVYKVRDVESDEVYAMKVVNLEEIVLMSDLAREISTLFDIDHDNIVKLKEVYPSVYDCSMIMEYVAEDLNEVIQQGGANNLETVKGWVWQLLCAVEFLHCKGLIHRDLKPENILIDHTGKLKLADIGSVRRFLDDGKLTPKVTTLQFRAPEVLVGSTSYSKPIDLWAVGCIFGEMVEGESLFGSKDGLNTEISLLHDIFRKLGTPCDYSLDFPTFGEEYPMASQVSSKLDLVANDLLLKLLSVDPNSRISAAEALKHPFFQDQYH